MSEAYEYRPLEEHKEIRLFRLHCITPATEDHEVEILGGIETASLSDNPCYTALSYVWGEPVLNYKILLDDGTHVAITNNLLVALLHVADYVPLAPNDTKTFRGSERNDVDAISTGVGHLSTDDTDPNLDVLLWIDAICINQSDGIEKSWQVAQMADVYSKARHTLIFLGPRTEHSDEAIEFFHKIGEEAVGYDALADIPTLDRHIWDVLHLCINDDPKLIDLHALDALIASIIERGQGDELSRLTSTIMDCTWWYRAWEFVLSSDPLFVFGNKCLHSRHFIATSALLIRLRLAIEYPHYEGVRKLGFGDFGRNSKRITYAGLELSMRRTSQQLTFLTVFTTLLNAEHGFEATDPRDVIFGVLGLIDFWYEGQKRIVPDYSMPCDLVYTNATLELLECGWIQVLRLAAAPKSRTDLPSWVVDFSNRMDPQVAARPPPKSNGMTSSYQPDQSGRHVLRVEGTYYGQIKCVGLRRWMIPDVQERSLVLELVRMNRRDLVHGYFSRLADMFGTIFSDVEKVRYQLYMLSAAICHGNLAGCFLGTEWNSAIYIRDIMMEPEILDGVPLYDMDLDTKMDLEGGRHALCNDPTPLCYEDGPITLRTLSYALSLFATSHMNCEPFIAGGSWVGSAMKSIEDGDVLAKLNIDPNTLYIIRRVNNHESKDGSGDGRDDLEEDLWKLVSVAFVPKFWTQKDFPEGEPTVFRFC